MKKKLIIFLCISCLAFSNVLVMPHITYAGSAGLAWGPKKVSNLKFYLTNPHKGWAGPKFPNHSHVNFHVDKKKTTGSGYTSVANYHIVKYKKSGKHCVYIYESHKKKTVMDSCGDSWKTVAYKASYAMKSFFKTILSNADYLATVAIWSVIGLVIIDLIIPGDPIPILPFSEPSPLESIEIYNETDYVTEPQPINDYSGFDPASELNPDSVSDDEGYTGRIYIDLTEITESYETINPSNEDPPGIPVPTDPTVKEY